MTVQDLYSHYRLMPQLIAHQLRVAGIVKLIKDDRDSILTALVHDMGNLAKFSNLDPAWTAEQLRFWQRYGKDAHVATIKILEEAGLTKLQMLVEEESQFYNQVVEVVDFSAVSLPSKLTLYADTRVMPHGVVSLEERIIDLATRYPEPRRDGEWGPKLEAHIQTLTTRNIRKITEADVTPLFDELLSYTL